MKTPRQLRLFARRFGLARALCLVLLGLFAALRIADPYLIEELRLRTFDTYQALDPRMKAAKPVAIVDIDEASLAKYGQWPWPRTRVADLVAALTRMGAIVVAFDVMFPEPDRLNPDVAADSFRNLDEGVRAMLRALPSNDEVLADTISSTRVVLGETGLPSVGRETADALPMTGVAMLGEDPKPFLFEFPGLLRNIAPLEQAAAGRGVLTIRPERDGIVRRVPMVVIAQEAVVPSLSLETLRVVTGTETILIRSDRAGIKSVAVDGFDVPTDANGQVWVHFAPRDRSIYVSAADVLDGRVPAESIARKLVLIGTSAAGLLDTKTTPIDRVMPGVEIHAQVLESVLSRAVLSQPNYGVGAELVAAIALGLLIIWLAPLFGPKALLAFGVAIAAGLIAVSWSFYVRHRLLIDFTYPLLSSWLIYLTLAFSSYVREQAQRRQIRSAFGQYLSPVLVEQLAQSPEKLVLGGEEREMTVMLSDVRGFTAISETYKHDPQGLTALMNRFLTPLTNAILDHKGTIDKYMGDAIMAFWNAPLEDDAHQINACAAALDMLDRLAALNQELEDEARESGRPFMPLKIGVGLNTGPCVVGNLGSDVHFDYSVLGDSVNVAARLESQTKIYGFPIIAGARTALAAKDAFAILEIDFVIVKGKTEPEFVYAIVGRKDMAATDEFQCMRSLLAEVLGCYRGHDWQGALRAIERGRQRPDLAGLGPLLELYAERVQAFQSNSPPENWNGAYLLLAK
ncbi:adenylate/guanylate cyclase domain-containing protein [Bradyrhizobium sp. LHD-71]|uniref:CHASE2 domain-containing protein n=1 Tax=Bradyrhizobium sp. LHD-71 TaxID=3072141 RepID=UPI00281073B7|nr:adenylate/guanylate cyclase domain-containing protein [Bradyrhizobium sp. LHD-71]MDQ8726340.1 adenylate/guanylate cyclase domain-containing protein [Bradyrhizobium sp. LHD-71]